MDSSKMSLAVEAAMNGETLKTAVGMEFGSKNPKRTTPFLTSVYALNSSINRASIILRRKNQERRLSSTRKIIVAAAAKP